MPPPTGDSLRALFETTLQPRLAALEDSRRAIRGVIAKAAALTVPPFVVLLASDPIATLLGLPDIVVAVAAFAAMLAAIVFTFIKSFAPAFAAQANYRARFKREIVSEIFRIVAPASSYEPFASLSEADFDASGLFNPSGSYTSDDRVRGQIAGTPFEAAEVRRRLRSGSGKRAHTHSVFHGLFIHLVVARRLSGTTLVQPAKAGLFQTGERNKADRRSTGDAEFDKEFSVFGTDETETRDLLTPAMCRGLLTLRQQTGRPVFAAFKNDRVYIGVHYNGSLFEPSILRTTSLKTLQQMADQFGLAEEVVQELNLHAQGQVGGVVNHVWPADAASDNPFESPVVMSGQMTEGDVWKLANAGTDQPVSEQDVAVPRPAETKVQIQHDASTATIDYGLPVSFFIQIAASVFCALVVLRAADDFGWLQPALAPAAGLLTALPLTAGVAGVVASYPLAALVMASLVGSLISMQWIVRVRRVVIGHDAIRIYRGLRPFPRRYVRPAFDRIVQVDRAVQVGKTTSPGLINPSASPILRSEEEARWVAAEMRRALKNSEGRIQNSETRTF